MGGIPAAEAEILRGPKPKGTEEEAQSREHMMTHLPTNPYCEVCSKAKIQRKQKRNTVVRLVPYGIPKKAPAKLGEQVTGDHFIKNGRGEVVEAQSG